MIVRDESANLPQCLEHVRHVADEIVVVDTGSHDDTVAVAQSLGAKVFCHAWRDSFAGARNVSLDRATGDWILWLDGDDRMGEEDCRQLAELVQTPTDRAFLFLLTNTGTDLAFSDRLLTTVAWQREGEPLQYALEGSVFVGGAAVQWLRDGLEILDAAPESETMARSLPSNEGVYFVPALSGLGAPYWDSSARGMLIGLTRATRREHLARAALEAMAYQSRDVVEAMGADAGLEIAQLQADGGATGNEWLMQFQADMLGIPVARAAIAETTALGAAAAAGIAIGLWDEEAFLAARRIDRTFEPQMDAAERERLYARWRDAVARARHWVGNSQSR